MVRIIQVIRNESDIRMDTHIQTGSESYPTFDREQRIFLKTAGGGQSRRTALTYQNGLAYFRSYLVEQYNWRDDTPISVRVLPGVLPILTSPDQPKQE